MMGHCQQLPGLLTRRNRGPLSGWPGLMDQERADP